jgi:(p)ppGpp synthase/HD superfamily hydrolase
VHQPQPSPSPVAAVLAALSFAASKHRDQRRKGVEATPYINHPIEVATLLACVGGITDIALLQAAILHDTLEDTLTTPEELEEHFGREVRQLVQEVTDDKRLPKQERKRLQIAHAPQLSPKARLLKLADKISNVRSVMEEPPSDWSGQRRQEYFDWSAQVVAGCRGSNAALEQHYDQLLEKGKNSGVFSGSAKEYG